MFLFTPQIQNMDHNLKQKLKQRNGFVYTILNNVISSTGIQGIKNSTIQTCEVMRYGTYM